MKKMKNIILTSILSMSFAIFAFEAFASEDLEVTVIENSQLIRMEVNDPTNEEIEVFLYNQNDRRLFTEKIGMGETFESQFDFTGLRNGTYTLISEVANMRLNRVIEVNENKVDLVDSYYTFLPVFSQENNKIKVHYLNQNGADIGVSVENGRNTYFDGYYNNVGEVFTKVYSLENLTAGTYQLRFTSQGEFYVHEFEVK